MRERGSERWGIWGKRGRSLSSVGRGSVKSVKRDQWGRRSLDRGTTIDTRFLPHTAIYLLPRPPAPPPGWTFSWALGGHSFPLLGASTTLPQPERRQILRGPRGLTQALVSDSGTRISAVLSISSASTPPRLATTWSAPPAFSVCRARPHCGGGGEPPTPRPALRVAVSLGRARATRRAGAEPAAMARRSGR